MRCLRVRWAINFGGYTRPAQWRCFKFHQRKCTQLSRSLQAIWHVANCPKQFKHANDQRTGPLDNLETLFEGGWNQHRCSPLKLIRFKLTKVAPTPQTTTWQPFHQPSSFRFLILSSLVSNGIVRVLDDNATATRVVWNAYDNKGTISQICAENQGINSTNTNTIYCFNV